MVTTIVAALMLAACGDSVTGVVIEKYDGKQGIPQSSGCGATEWLLVIDRGERIKSTSRFKKKCVSFTTATKYNIGSKYP